MYLCICTFMTHELMVKCSDIFPFIHIHHFTIHPSLVNAMSKIRFIFHQILGRTCMSPTVNLERHLMWDDIAILARYLLMLSFNNCLDGIKLLLIVLYRALTSRESMHFDWN